MSCRAIIFLVALGTVLFTVLWPLATPAMAQTDSTLESEAKPLPPPLRPSSAPT